MNELVTIYIIVGIFVLSAAFIYGLSFLMKRQNRRAAIDSIKNGTDVFLTWHYSPEDWKPAAEEYFQIKPRRHLENGKASFTNRFVYISNGRDELLYELIGSQRHVKHLTEVYLSKQSEQKVIRFEVRTKTIKKDDNGNETMEEDFDVESYYVPVPKAADAEGEKVLNFYRDILDKNADAVAAVMPFGLGIFKN
jgi:hypothetical protein